MSDEEGESKPNIIIDNGSKYIKAGLSGEEGPIAVFPSCVGYPKFASGMIGGDKKEFFVGADAEAKRDELKINYPIQKGWVKNWDDMEIIWGHIFTNELKIAPEEHNVLLTQDPMNPKDNKEKATQIMFETFNVPGLYISNNGVLTLYSAGKSTGMTIDLGYSLSHFMPIDGFPIKNAYIWSDFAGKELTEYMKSLLQSLGYYLSKASEREIPVNIKEKSCFVALDFDEELGSVEPFDYELPDGTHVIIKDERIRCPEALFRPSMIGKEGNGISQTCCDSIQKCKENIRKDLYNCIILSGGTSMFNGLPERLTKDVKALAPESMKEEVKVIASPERKFAVWIGGSILSSISTFESEWITKEEYEESGSTIVHKKCD